MYCVILKPGMMTKSRALYYEVLSLHIRIAKESYDKFALILKMSLYNYPIKESLQVIYNDFLPIETLPKEEKIQLCKNMYVMGNLF